MFSCYPDSFCTKMLATKNKEELSLAHQILIYIIVSLSDGSFVHLDMAHNITASMKMFTLSEKVLAIKEIHDALSIHFAYWKKTCDEYDDDDDELEEDATALELSDLPDNATVDEAFALSTSKVVTLGNTWFSSSILRKLSRAQL